MQMIRWSELQAGLRSEPLGWGLGCLEQRDIYCSLKFLLISFLPQTVPSGPPLSLCLFLNICFMDHLRWFLKFRSSSFCLVKPLRPWTSLTPVGHLCCCFHRNAPQATRAPHAFCTTQGKGVGNLLQRAAFRSAGWGWGINGSVQLHWPLFCAMMCLKSTF